MDRQFLAKKCQYYLRLSDSLSSLDLDGVEIIPQTMAPFLGILGANVIKIFLLMPKNADIGAAN